MKDPHLETFFGSQTTYPIAIEQAESDVSAEHLDADSWERNHFTAAHSDNQGDSSWSGTDLNTNRRIHSPGSS